jgi:uncharacterized protein YyaL (SSP411 family)
VSGGYQATGKEEYAQTARATSRTCCAICAPGGGFFAAQDSDRAGRDEKIIADWNGLMIAALAYSERAR